MRRHRLLIALALAAALLGGDLGARWVTWFGRPPLGQPPRTAAAARRPTLDAQIERLQSVLRELPNEPRSLGELGAAYLQKVRETGDPSYYPKAETVLRRAHELDPSDGEVMTALGVLALARHQFTAGLDWGERARRRNAASPRALGVIADAQIELGRYDDAFTTIQAMVDARPDLRSYARVSYARELIGDVPGAITMMERAVAAGGIGTENTVWTRVELGNLRFNSGDLAGAEAEYARAAPEGNDFVPALAGLARVRAARGEYDAAISLYTRVVAAMPTLESVVALGDVYQVAGRPENAARHYHLAKAIDQLYRANGVDTDVEAALFAADHGDDPAATVARARSGASRRPGIKGSDALAWALYRAGEFAAARRASEAALRLGTQDALLRFHAGMIADRLDDRAAARRYLRSALDINPYFSVLYAPEARRVLGALTIDQARAR